MENGLEWRTGTFALLPLSVVSNSDEQALKLKVHNTKTLKPPQTRNNR